MNMRGAFYLLVESVRLKATDAPITTPMPHINRTMIIDLNVFEETKVSPPLLFQIITKISVIFISYLKVDGISSSVLKSMLICSGAIEFCGKESRR